MNAVTKLNKALEKLVETTKARDEYEIEYELHKAKLMFSSAVRECRNAQEREAKVIAILGEEDHYRKMAELKSDARVAYYTWSTIKSIIDSNKF